MPASTLALGASDFIQLTTFRRSGQGVPTPVWVVLDGGALAVFTPAGTGKLKRIGHTARVTVAECNRRGRVADDVEPVAATATTTADPAEVERVTRLLAAKYGLQFRLFMLVERVLSRGERRREVVHIVPDDPGGEAAATA
jgi:uncharacterized protein